MDESIVHAKVLELRNEIGVFHSSLIRPIAKLLVPITKRQFQLYDNFDSDSWIEYVMNGEKITIDDDKLVFETSGRSFTLIGDNLKIFTDYRFNLTDSPDAKLFINFRVAITFDILARGKSLGDKNLIKKQF